MMGSTIDSLNFQFCSFSKRNHLLGNLFDRNRDRDGHADHRVVARAQEAHHFDVSSGNILKVLVNQ